MKNIRNLHSGFTLIEVCIVLVFVGIVGAVGYLSYNRITSNSSDKTTNITVPVDNLVTAHNQFGFNVLRQVKDDNRNALISPTSIFLALSMTYNGAQNETYASMQKTLGLQKYDLDKLNNESKSLDSSLEKPDEKVELSIANSLWLKDGITFNKETLKTIESNYNSEVKTLDFTASSAPNTINKWVSDNTNGKIPTVVNKIPADMRMYLINAIYFNGSWTKEFNKNSNYDDTFTTARNGDQKVTYMSKSEDGIDYLKNSEFEAVRLPYGKNERLAMYFVLPSKIDSFVDTVSTEKWNSWTKEFKKKEGTIEAPKFKVEYENTLDKTLQSMGMNIAYSDDADFSKFSTSTPLKIGEVKHKTFIDVNESGTEAAAVTSVGMVETTSVQPENDRFYLKLNRPFFYAIADTKTGELIFTGILNNPKN